MSIDHVAIQTHHYDTVVSFYEAVLSTLGYRKLITIDHDKAVGFGARFPSFWVHRARATSSSLTPSGTHIAFVASSRHQVDNFYRAALMHGAKDNGSPGLRPQYHRFYYAAFVIDADGNNIEAVNHIDWKSYVTWKTIPLSIIVVALMSFTISKVFFSE
jgi:catechol 2,3-dioxygenase-like lactoylglutathione lyase family enzyme